MPSEGQRKLHALALCQLLRQAPPCALNALPLLIGHITSVWIEVSYARSQPRQLQVTAANSTAARQYQPCALEHRAMASGADPRAELSRMLSRWRATLRATLQQGLTTILQPSRGTQWLWWPQKRPRARLPGRQFLCCWQLTSSMPCWRPQGTKIHCFPCSLAEVAQILQEAAAA